MRNFYGTRADGKRDKIQGGGRSAGLRKFLSPAAQGLAPRGFRFEVDFRLIIDIRIAFEFVFRRVGREIKAVAAFA